MPDTGLVGRINVEIGDRVALYRDWNPGGPPHDWDYDVIGYVSDFPGLTITLTQHNPNKRNPIPYRPVRGLLGGGLGRLLNRVMDDLFGKSGSITYDLQRFNRYKIIPED